KCSFDDHEYRKAVENKRGAPKDKPINMCKIDWRYLVDYWSDPMKNSNKACAIRSLQKMPHYNGTKSFARLKQEIDEMKKGIEQREQGLNEKTDEQIFQDVLRKDTHEVIDNAKQAIQEARNDAENARKEAEDARKEAEDNRKYVELAKNEAERTRSEVDQKIAANNDSFNYGSSA
ncbi:Lichenan-specific phosphotransferase enzyme IIA component, partial [Bienertia sinuspersici]